MKRFLILVMLISLVGCGGAQSTVQPSQPTATIGLAERPTAAVGQVTPQPNQSTAEPSDPTRPTETSQPSQPTNPPAQAITWSVVFNNTQVGSLESIDSNGVHHVLADATIPERELIWAASPNGQKVAVIVATGSGTAKMQGFDTASVWVVGIDESNPTKLLELRGNIDPNDPNDLIFVADRGGATANPYFQRLNWINNDEVIVTSIHEGNQVDLYAVNVNDSSVRRLTNTPEIEYSAVISPDRSHLVFATASTFGTGGGFGDAHVWRMNLADAHAWRIDPDGAYTLAQVIGWLDQQRVVVSTSNNGNGQTTYWLADETSTKANTTTTAGDGWINNGQVVLINAVGRGSGEVSLWDGASEQSTPLNLRADMININPYGDGLIACDQTQRTLWRNNTTIQLSPGDCKNAVWNPDGRLALSDMIVEPDNAIRETKSNAGDWIVGWNGSLLYYVHGVAPNQGQLFSYDANTNDVGKAIGEPFAGTVSQPVFVNVKK